jgi:hypothetical protein
MLVKTKEILSYGVLLYCVYYLLTVSGFNIVSISDLCSLNDYL